MNVFDKIADQNEKLWKLLTDQTLTHVEKMALIEELFPDKSRRRAVKSRREAWL